MVETMVDTDRLQNTDNTDRQAQLNGNPKGLLSLNSIEGGGAEKQWTQDKLTQTADKRRKSMKKEAVVGQWDEKRRETWASDHKAALPLTPPTSDLLESCP